MNDLEKELNMKNMEVEIIMELKKKIIKLESIVESYEIRTKGLVSIMKNTHDVIIENIRVLEQK